MIPALVQGDCALVSLLPPFKWHSDLRICSNTNTSNPKSAVMLKAAKRIIISSLCIQHFDAEKPRDSAVLIEPHRKMRKKKRTVV